MRHNGSATVVGLLVAGGVVAAVVLAGGEGSRAPRRPPTPAPVVSPAASPPDGGRAARVPRRPPRPSGYLLVVSDGPKGQGVYRLGAGRRHVTLMAPRDGPAYSPTWSPTTTRIAFHGYAADSPASPDAVYVYDLRDGSIDARIGGRGGQAHPSWAPDGNILFGANDGFVHSVRPDGTRGRRLLRGEFPDMSAGHRLAFVRNDHLWITRRAARGAEEIPGTSGATAPDWAPDGDRIAFAAHRGRGSAIYVLDVATGDVRRVTPRGGRHLTPSWSPDAHYLAYVDGRHGVATIRVIRSVGGPSRRISPRGQSLFDPEWWPG